MQGTDNGHSSCDDNLPDVFLREERVQIGGEEGIVSPLANEIIFRRGGKFRKAPSPIPQDFDFNRMEE